MELSRLDTSAQKVAANRGQPRLEMLAVVSAYPAGSREIVAVTSTRNGTESIHCPVDRHTNRARRDTAAAADRASQMDTRWMGTISSGSASKRGPTCT